jgi:peptidoglycan/xylan/chitin deacetylase (PgdA/CDA1 family)
MLHRFLRHSRLLLLIAALPAAAHAQQIAFTFDDLPAHSSLPPGVTRQQVAASIIAALQSAHLPPVYGFVNGIRVQEDPATIHVLEAWRAAGFPLGDHSWSHMNPNTHTLAEFESDILRNQPLLRRQMPAADWHWFRFPFLAEGDTPEKHAAIRVFLAQQGYRIANVTMSFEDYSWNDPYARCSAAGNTTAIAQLESSYLTAAEQNIVFYRQMSHTLYARDIPYVLLMHLGAFDAHMLPRLLTLYQSHGFTFITLQQAESDPFYKSDIDLALPSTSDRLEAQLSARHLPTPPRPKPSINRDTLCR